MGQEVPRIARSAVDRAVARLEGKGLDDTEVVVTPHLVTRGTTAPPRGF